MSTMIALLTTVMYAGCVNDKAEGPVDNTGATIDSGCSTTGPLCNANSGQFGVTCESERAGYWYGYAAYCLTLVLVPSTDVFPVPLLPKPWQLLFV